MIEVDLELNTSCEGLHLTQPWITGVTNVLTLC